MLCTQIKFIEFTQNIVYSRIAFVYLFVLISISHSFFFSFCCLYISISLIALTNNYIGILNLGEDVVTNVIFGAVYMKDYTS